MPEGQRGLPSHLAFLRTGESARLFTSPLDRYDFSFLRSIWVGGAPFGSGDCQSDPKKNGSPGGSPLWSHRGFPDDPCESSWPNQGEFRGNRRQRL